METQEERIILVASPPKDGEALIIDEEVYKTLEAMFKSSDQENWKMGQFIINSCDIQKSIYWLWRLANYYSYRMVNLRTKAGRYIRDNAQLLYIAQLNAPNFLEHLIRKGWLTSEIYRTLEEEYVHKLRRQCYNEFYNISIQIKDEYKHFTDNVSPINFEINE